MNVYDTANKLATELRESLEYKNYKKLKKEVSENEGQKAKIEEFERKRYEAQLQAMQGEKSEEKTKQLEELYSILINNKDIKDFFDAEVKFNVLLADVNRIIAEAVKDVL